MGENLKNDKYGVNLPQLNYVKITGSLWRFDIYTHPFITGIVNERFDMCLVGNIRLKSRSKEGKHDVMKNESSELELWLFKVPWLLSNHQESWQISNDPGLYLVAHANQLNTIDNEWCPFLLVPSVQYNSDAGNS